MAKHTPFIDAMKLLRSQVLATLGKVQILCTKIYGIALFSDTLVVHRELRANMVATL